jgi:hypothetical protein
MKSWGAIRQAIADEYPPSVLLFREKMKSVLGFTSREHEEWFDLDVNIRDVSYGTRYCVISMHLDFYNEPKRTMFLLKYGDFMHESDQNH